MTLLALMLALQTASGPWDQYRAADESARIPKEGDTASNPTTGEKLILRDGVWRPVLGSGPHTLIVTDGTSMTRMDYKTGPDCQHARDTVERQVAPPRPKPGVIYGAPTTRAVCVPR